MKKEITSKTYKFTLNLIYLSQVAVMIMFSLVVLLLNASGQVSLSEDSSSVELTNLFQIIVPLVAIIFLSSGYFIFKLLLSKINRSLPLTQKLPKYQIAVITRSAMLELPGLLGAVAALITGKMYFLLATLLIVIVFILIRPTPFTIAEDLNLNEEEKARLENPDAIVAETDEGFGV